MRKSYRILIKTMVVVLGVLSLMTLTGSAFAESALSEEEAYNKVLLNMMSQCYESGQVSPTIETYKYRQNDNTDRLAFEGNVLKGSMFSWPIRVPTTLATSDGNKVLASCNQLFLGGGQVPVGVFDLYGKSLPKHDSPDLVTELKNIGYEYEDSTDVKIKCINVTYHENEREGDNPSAGSACWVEGDSTKGPKMNTTGVMLSGGGSGKLVFTYQGPVYDPMTTDVTFIDPNGESCVIASFGKDKTAGDINEFDGAWCSTAPLTYRRDYPGYYTAEATVGLPPSDAGFKVVSFKYPLRAYQIARKFMEGGDGLFTQFGPDDVYVLYKYYLNNVYEMGEGSGGCKKRSDLKDGPVVVDESGNKVYYVFEDGVYRSKSFKNLDAKVSVFPTVISDVGERYLTEQCDGVECLIKRIWDLNLPETEGMCGEDGEPGGGGGKPDKEDWRKGELVDCNKFENIGAMEWVLCPVMNNGQYTATWIDNLTQEWLEVKPDLYSSTTEDGKGTSKVYEVWDRIRNIANILMVIFFLVIIFSQVTGYGIDNYGIKKMLPRLIVMAIVINLSLYICQIAVDLSNITGVGLRNMFSSIGMSVGSEKAEAGSFISDMIFGLFATASVGGPTALAGATLVFSLGLGTVVAVVILVIVLVMVVLVAVIVLFLMLGAREIMVVACIVLSPLAFAAFILPNTQNLFKKWWELFKAALIIFPVCGMMAGISNLLRYGLFTENTSLHMWGYAVLMVLPYLGFFLIPMLIKNAISALGKVGGALTAMGGTIKNGGKAIGRGALKAGQNTNAFKDWQERASQARLERVRDKVQRKGDKASIGDRRRALEAGRKLQEMRTRDELAKLGISNEAIENRALATREAQGLKNYSDQYANLTRAQVGKELKTAITAYGNDRSDENALRLQAAVIAAEGRGMNKEMLDEFGNLELNSTEANDAKILSRLAGSSDKILSQYGIQMGKIADDNYENAQGQKLTKDDKNIALNDFIKSQSAIKLSDVSAGKGPSWLSAANDDTWNAFLQKDTNGHYDVNALKAIDTHSLIEGANNTTDGKVVTKINQILNARKAAGIQEDYSMSTAELAKLKSPTAAMLENTGVYDKAVAAIKADPNSAANQQILNSMDQNVREQLRLDDASLVQARGMESEYVNKTANDVYDEAMAENARRDAQKQQEVQQQQEEMNRLHGQALEENKEWDRRQAEIKQREEQTRAMNRMADVMEKTANGGRGNQSGDNNSGNGFNGGAGI